MNIKEVRTNNIYKDFHNMLISLQNPYPNLGSLLIDFFSEDASYRRLFKACIYPKIYHKHAAANFTCCVFCTHLKKYHCHDFCFTCSKGTYKDCSHLLPGIFPYKDSYFDAVEEKYMPWIFRTPCTRFERLEYKRYFKHFSSFTLSARSANYEVLEGIFLGISQGRRPCHICASVNLDIYKKCSDEDMHVNKFPCDKIVSEISEKHMATKGMIRYME